MELPKRTKQETAELFNNFVSSAHASEYNGKSYVDEEYGEVPLQNMKYEFVHFNGRWQFELDDRENEYVITFFAGPSSDSKIFFGFPTPLERKKFVQNFTNNGTITQVSTGMNLESLIPHTKKKFGSAKNVAVGVLGFVGLLTVLGTVISFFKKQ